MERWCDMHGTGEPSLAGSAAHERYHEIPPGILRWCLCGLWGRRPTSSSFATLGTTSEAHTPAEGQRFFSGRQGHRMTNVPGGQPDARTAKYESVRFREGDEASDLGLERIQQQTSVPFKPEWLTTNEVYMRSFPSSCTT